MKLVLSASATYYTAGETNMGDLVLADIWLLDTDTDTYYPDFVETGTCQLRRNEEVMDSADFDLRHGNGDGSIHVVFNHPAEIRNLRVRVVLQTFSNGNFSIDVPVMDQSGQSTNLAAQPGNR